MTISRLVLALLGVLSIASAHAEDSVKLGVVLPLSGPFSLAGIQALAGMRTWLALHGKAPGTPAYELVVKDDTANPAVSRRLTQELVVNDHVRVLLGYGLAPLGAAAAPIATQARLPIIMTGVGAKNVPAMSPYAVRVFETLPQISYAVAKWALAHDIRRVVSIVADYTPGYDSEAAFIRLFEAGGGKVVEALRTPVDSVDFSPYLQRAKDARPDAVFVFQPEGPGGVLLRQYHDRGLLQAGIKFLGDGDIVPEEIIARGDAGFALDTYSAQAYASGLDTPENREFVAAYEKFSDGAAPDVQSVSGYDAMQLIDLAMRKAGASADGTALLNAMRGQHFISPRGPISVDPETRDITQDVYFREFQMVDGKVANVILQTYRAVPAEP